MNVNQIRQILKKWGTGEFQWIEEQSDEELARELAKISQLKRFLQRWNSNQNFRQQSSNNLYQIFSQHHLNLDFGEAKLLIELLNREQRISETLPNTFLPKAYQGFSNVRLNWCDHLKKLANSSINPRFKAWRQRQIARCKSQIINWQNPHLLTSFELSKGCSIGCWFCGVSAPKISDIYFYNQENSQLWRSVLSVMKELLGSASGSGFCYWATDPLDNPHYEEFLRDFHEILEIFPQTTTAQPLKDPARTRALLNLSRDKGCMLNRFSILSLKTLDQLHEEFSPEELAFVDLALQNAESGTRKSNSGRAREQHKRKVEKNNNEVFDDSLSGTSACVTGFLFNMVDRSVKLISPCNACDRWPLGQIVYDEGTFADANDLKALLERMIGNNMSLTVSELSYIRFRSDLRYESLPNGFQLSTRFLTLKFKDAPYIKQLGEIIHQGNKTAAEIADLMLIWDISLVDTFQTLNQMFNQGVFEEVTSTSQLRLPDHRQLLIKT